MKTEPDNMLSRLDIEIAVAHYYNPRFNVIVPNISHGMGLHECDLLILTKAGYAIEIEIKISKADLIADKKKKHHHNNRKIKGLYFALPYYLFPDCEQYVPDDAGIIKVFAETQVVIIRKATVKNNYKFSAEEKFNLVRLGAMRIWTLKRIIRNNHKTKDILELK